MDAKQGLYTSAYEHDACGVGMVVNIHGGKSHELVDNPLFLYIYVPMRSSPVYVPSLNSAFFSEHLSCLYIIRFLFTYLTY